MTFALFRVIEKLGGRADLCMKGPRAKGKGCG